jgi:hypothetical protein
MLQATNIGDAIAPLAVSISELVILSTVSRATIYAQIAAGKLKTRKIGKRTIVLMEDVFAWLRGEPAGEKQ